MRLSGFIFIVLGALLIVLSFVWESMYPPETRWTQEQAEEHARAGAQLHHLAHPGGHAHAKGESHSHSHSHSHAERKVNAAELKAARLRWENSKAALAAATTQSSTTADWLRYGGTAAALAGVVALVLDQKRRSNTRSIRDDS
jgi:hypothetical protein